MSQHDRIRFPGVISKTARTSLYAAVLGGGLLAGCGLPEDDLDYSEHESALAVSAYTTSGCSTSVVVGLSKQIAEEIGCMSAGSLVRFTPSKNLTFTSNAVLPYISATAKIDLEKVAATRVVQINSGFRTVAQQYLLFRWFQLKRCGIAAAATPGNSNHESGRALDVQNYSTLISAMAARGWSHPIPNDPVHFEHASSPDIRGRDVKAFQRLWNRNNPAAKIAEDGVYGPQTEAKLRASPATGFANGAVCAARVAGADVVMIDGPDKIAPGGKAHYAITVNNNSDVDWPASTRITVEGGGASALYDSASWVSPSEVGTIGLDVAAGAQHIIDLDIAAPMVTEETPLFTQLSLSANGSSYGTFNIAVTVTPNGDEDTSGDSADENDPDMITGGCATGSGTSWAALLIPALIVLRRRGRKAQD